LIGLDTNIVVRRLLQDDPEQSRAADRLFQQSARPDGDPCFISLATMLETVWVLRSRYRFKTDTVAAAVQSLLSTEGVIVQNEREVFMAMVTMRDGRGSFEDALIGSLGTWIGCEATLTFDRKAIGLPGFRLASS
jgi:predicted nucleic-acid-binding protein